MSAMAAQTPWNPPGSFQKTDIVRWWELETIVGFIYLDETREVQ
jgi:hypothetical protein